MSDKVWLPSAPTGTTRAAWRRWEMHEVNAAPVRDTPEPPAESEPDTQTETPEADADNLDHLLEQVLEQARREGHAQGREAGLVEGKQAGYEQGHAEGLDAGLKQAQSEQNQLTARLDTMLSAAEQALATLDAQVAQGIVDLALRLARQVVQTTVAARPEALLDTVRELLQPQEGQLSWIRLHIHPDDHDMLAQYFRSQSAVPSWQLPSDDTITAGGCRLETSLGQIDATLQTRWQRVAGSLEAA